MNNAFEPPKSVGNFDVNAYCPICQARSNFLYKDSGGREYGYSTFASNELRLDRSNIEGDTYNGEILFRLLVCSSCGLAGLGEFHSKVLDRFFPTAKQMAEIPDNTPKEIESELRSAENCAGIEEYRPASAMLRSTIEKILKAHGYIDELKWSLNGKLKVIAKDNILPRYLIKQNEEIVKILGDEILHGEYREVTSDEYSKAHHYTVRFIEAFYDDHDTVVEELKELGRLGVDGNPVIPEKSEKK